MSDIDSPGSAGGVLPAARFPYVSRGYSGFSHPGATLNSRFYALLWEGLTPSRLRDERVFFPQRMPRPGFFDELIAAESAGAAKNLRERRTLLADDARRIALDPSAHATHAVNLTGLAGRYGVVDIPDRWPGSTRLETPDDFRLALNLCAISVNKAVAQSEASDLQALHALCLAAEKSAAIDSNLKAHVWNRYLVTGARHGSVGGVDGFAGHVSALLGAYLEADKPESFTANISSSVLWRGYAMARSLDQAGRTRALEEAERCALAADPRDEQEAIIKDENRMTLLQTLAKWRGRSDADRGFACLKEMAELDPHDSTAYSETGLLHLKAKNWPSARESFARAAELGPPALAMNLFFKGQAELELSMDEEAVGSWTAAANLDPSGLSPRLSLLQHYDRSGDRSKRDEIRNAILETEILRTQLEPEELQNLVAG